VALFLGQTRVYAGDGAGHWTLAATIVTEPACGHSALRAGTDIDHNGYPDFAFVAEEDCSPWVGGTNALHCFAESSAPGSPAVYPQYPRGGETWIAGSVQFIYWHAAVPAEAGQPSMMLELSVYGPDGPFAAAASDVPNGGRYQWTIPRGIANSQNCHWRFTLATDPPTTSITPTAFTIINPAAPGDLDGDGDVDLEDAQVLVGCLTGPEAAPGLNCGAADLDGDIDVDLADFGQFQILFPSGGV
jgi:hypothetical protein